MQKLWSYSPNLPWLWISEGKQSFKVLCIHIGPPPSNACSPPAGFVCTLFAQSFNLTLCEKWTRASTLTWNCSGRLDLRTLKFQANSFLRFSEVSSSQRGGACVCVSSVLVVLLYGIYITNSPSPPLLLRIHKGLNSPSNYCCLILKDYCSSDSCRISPDGLFYCPLVINGCDFSPVTLMCRRNWLLIIFHLFSFIICYLRNSFLYFFCVEALWQLLFALYLLLFTLIPKQKYSKINKQSRTGWSFFSSF